MPIDHRYAQGHRKHGAAGAAGAAGAVGAAEEVGAAGALVKVFVSHIVQ